MPVSLPVSDHDRPVFGARSSMMDALWRGLFRTPEGPRTGVAHASASPHRSRGVVPISLQAPAAVLLCAGGGLIVWGATSSWFTLFAGLHAYPGTLGQNGKVLMWLGAALGVVGCLLLGAAVGAHRAGARGQAGEAVPAERSRPGPGRIYGLIPILGWLLAMVGLGVGVAAQLLRGRVQELLSGDASDPMLVAELGPGLPLILAGGIAVAGAGVATALAWRHVRAGPDPDASTLRTPL